MQKQITLTNTVGTIGPFTGTHAVGAWGGSSGYGRQAVNNTFKYWPLATSVSRPTHTIGIYNTPYVFGHKYYISYKWTVNDIPIWEPGPSFFILYDISSGTRQRYANLTPGYIYKTESVFTARQSIINPDPADITFGMLIESINSYSMSRFCTEDGTPVTLTLSEPLLVDLTNAYGNGNEPSLSLCSTWEWFQDTTTVTIDELNNQTPWLGIYTRKDGTFFDIASKAVLTEVDLPKNVQPFSGNFKDQDGNNHWLEDFNIISPKNIITNLIPNAGFNDLTEWTFYESTTPTVGSVLNNVYNYKFTKAVSTAMITQVIDAPESVFYMRGTIIGGFTNPYFVAQLLYDNQEVDINLSCNTNDPYIISGVHLASAIYRNFTLYVYMFNKSKANETISFTQPMLIDLTACFGAGNEPVKEVCDAWPFFEGSIEI